MIILAFALSDQFTKEMVLSGKKKAVVLKHLKICTTYYSLHLQKNQGKLYTDRKKLTF